MIFSEKPSSPDFFPPLLPSLPSLPPRGALLLGEGAGRGGGAARGTGEEGAGCPAPTPGAGGPGARGQGAEGGGPGGRSPAAAPLSPSRAERSLCREGSDSGEEGAEDIKSPRGRKMREKININSPPAPNRPNFAQKFPPRTRRPRLWGGSGGTLGRSPPLPRRFLDKSFFFRNKETNLPALPLRVAQKPSPSPSVCV